MGENSATVGDLLDTAAARWPDGLALLGPSGRRWSFPELRVEARRVASALSGLVGPGERVAAWAPNSAQWWLLQLGAGLAGVTLVTVNPAYRPAELVDVLGRSRAAAVVHAERFRGVSLPELLAQVRHGLPELRHTVSLRDWDGFLAAGDPAAQLPRVRPGDPAQIQYTSGTTGAPKGAVLSHGATVANAAAAAARWEVTPGEVWLNAMPMFHVAGSVINALGALAAGATQLITPFDPVALPELIGRHRVRIGCLGGTMWTMLLDHAGAADLSSVRLAITGGQPIAPELVARIEARTGGRVSILYGMTELCGTVTAVGPDDDPTIRAHTCGHPLPGVALRVVDPTSGAVLAPDRVGEVQARGRLTMSGYFEDPAATRAALSPQGWLRTGDLGALDPAGRLRISGRAKEMIIRGAENIYPTEIENRLRAHPAIADAAVVGLPDPLYGETVAAALVLAEGATLPATDQLIAFCRHTLAPFKTPQRWMTLPALPMTPSGKVRKFEVRQALLHADDPATDRDGPRSTVAPAPRQPICSNRDTTIPSGPRT